MFYKIKSSFFIAILISLISNNAYSQEVDILSEEIVQAPLAKESNDPLSINIDLGITPPAPKAAVQEVKEELTEAKEELKETSKNALISGPIAEIKSSAQTNNEQTSNLNKNDAKAEEKFAAINEELNQKIAQKEEEAKKLLQEYEQSVDNELFNQMSDIEKESALLTLELKREKIKNDIDAVKKQRQAAEDQEKERKEAIEEKKREKIQEDQRKMLVEQQKLKEAEIEFEKLRQEKLVAQYKENMLEQKQKWITNNAALYKNINALKEEQIKSFDGIKTKFTSLDQLTKNATQNVLKAKETKDAEIAVLNEQIIVLKAQVKSLQAENPFQDEEGGRLYSLDDLYVIMEIRGQDDELIARLLNREGQSFLAQKGTILQNGYVVTDITKTYVKAEKEDKVEHINFISGGSIMQKEPLKKSSGDAINNTSQSTGQEASVQQQETAKPKKSFNIYTG